MCLSSVAWHHLEKRNAGELQEHQFARSKNKQISTSEETLQSKKLSLILNIINPGIDHYGSVTLGIMLKRLAGESVPPPI